MKKIVFTAIALAIATPALASSQLERQLGVEPGLYTTAELAALQLGRSHETGDGARVTARVAHGSDVVISSSNAMASAATGAAIEIFASSHETGDGARLGQVAPTVIDGPSGANLDALRHFAKSWETGDGIRF